MDHKSNTVGIALSGGGIRGAAHLGVLKVLKQNGIFPDMISGTSAGSIAGAVFAAGLDIDEFVDDLMDHIGINLLDPAYISGYILLFLYYLWSKKPIFHWLLPDGILKGNKLEKYFDDILDHKNFDELYIPLFIISVDINTGETVVFGPSNYLPINKMKDAVFITDAKVSEAIRASISLPGIFIPKKLHGRKLVDGGVKNNIPLDVLYYNDIDKILAVDLRVPKERMQADNIIEILITSFDIVWRELSNIIEKCFPAYFIYPEVSEIKYKDYKKIPQIVKHGEKIALRELKGIKNYLGIF